MTLNALIARIRAGAWVDAPDVLPLLVQLADDRAALERIGEVLAANGCDCDEDVRPEGLLDAVEDEDELCLAHRIERAWKRKPDAQ